MVEPEGNQRIFALESGADEKLIDEGVEEEEDNT